MQQPQGTQGPQGPPRPTPEQIEAIRRQIAIDAQKAGMSVPEFVQHLQQKARQQMMAQQQAAAAGGAPGPPGQPGLAGQPGQPGPPMRSMQGGAMPGQQHPITPGPPNPVAIAMAKFLRGQELKLRTVILNGERKEMFRVKRALRALQTPAYEKARTKNPALPAITDRASLENAFKLLPLSMLALRVSKVEDAAKGKGGAKQKHIKGQWTVTIERQQEAADDMYYVWFYEGSQVMRKVYAGLALLAIFAVVLYPLWPLRMRQGVYYLSWGFLGLLGLFFLMAIFRVILFCLTYFVVPPGLWLYPNLWEDVSFMDSFRPMWAWHDPNPKKKKKSKASSSAAQSAFAGATGQPAPATATITATSTLMDAVPTQRLTGYKSPQVEEVEDEE